MFSGLRPIPVTVVTVVLASILTACASSHVLIGTQRPPISPDQVRVYIHPPARYEEVAIVDASSKESFAFSDQQKMNKVIYRMKEEAAGLGANGLLLEGVGDMYAGSVGSGFGSATANGNTAYSSGLGVSAGVFQKTGKGMAIYVPPQ
jgi:hypothetical protein